MTIAKNRAVDWIRRNKVPALRCFIAVLFLRRKRNDAPRGPSACAGFLPSSLD